MGSRNGCSGGYEKNKENENVPAAVVVVIVCVCAYSKWERSSVCHDI